MHVKSSASGNENQLKCEKERFYWGVSEINSEDGLFSIFHFKSEPSS